MSVFTTDVAVNAQVVVGLELRATVQLAAGRADLAAGFLQLASDVANRNHPGWFVSPALEQMILDLGQTLDADAAGVYPLGPIVHVLADDAGAVIQSAREWWRLDTDARLLALPDRSTGPLAAARELREQMAGASLVVIHGSGAAIAPLVALAGWATRPPAMLVEPERLAFWGGIGVLDAVIHQSSTAVALAAERRCLPTGRSVLIEPHERSVAEELCEVLREARERITGWPPPRPPTALLPALPSLIDQRVLSQQVEQELADGVAGALRRWQVPSDLTARPGWVVLARDADGALRTIRDLLARDPRVFPDVVVVDVNGRGELSAIAEELAGVVELIQPDRGLDLDTATELGVRQLVSDHILITTDGAGTDVDVVVDLDLHLRAGIDAIGVGGLAFGERCEMRRHPRHVGWPTAVVLGHPAGSGRRPEVTPSPEGTHVRETSEITESREKLFHTDSEVPVGPSDPEQ